MPSICKSKKLIVSIFMKSLLAQLRVLSLLVISCTEFLGLQVQWI